ncbi:MAG: hypothetical protein UR85_C0011G0013 [Candidatus Nomurabacteria bacterium GW2011_GWF2_35_66]|nr:MAG: hypothetical protein UR85_C0011G0013 [Candidatus Nomurabacteria bacterium GW2011_GWF2_35_66]HBM45419.1 hypothetical protein [Patescibacteria group bacterium]
MKKKGFTLIELLVVIAIIGILSSVVVVSLQSARVKARDAKRIADVDAIKSALSLYYDSNASYPALIGDLVPAFLNSEPTLAAPTDAYTYTASADGLSYHLGITLEQAASTTGPLAGDKDCSSLVADECFTGVGASGFDGADPVYDVTP